MRVSDHSDQGTVSGSTRKTPNTDPQDPRCCRQGHTRLKCRPNIGSSRRICRGWVQAEFAEINGSRRNLNKALYEIGYLQGNTSAEREEVRSSPAPPPARSLAPGRAQLPSRQRPSTSAGAKRLPTAYSRHPVAAGRPLAAHHRWMAWSLLFVRVGCPYHSPKTRN